MRRRLVRWRGWTRRLARDHPFLLSFVVAMLVITVGLVRMEQIQRNACHAGNEARANQIDLWNFIIKTSTRPNQTPEQRRQIAAVEQRLHDIFAPRHCA